MRRTARPVRSDSLVPVCGQLVLGRGRNLCEGNPAPCRCSMSPQRQASRLLLDAPSGRPSRRTRVTVELDPAHGVSGAVRRGGIGVAPRRSVPLGWHAELGRGARLLMPAPPCPRAISPRPPRVRPGGACRHGGRSRPGGAPGAAENRREAPRRQRLQAACTRRSTSRYHRAKTSHRDDATWSRPDRPRQASADRHGMVSSASWIRASSLRRRNCSCCSSPPAVHRPGVRRGRTRARRWRLYKCARAFMPRRWLARGLRPHGHLRGARGLVCTWPPQGCTAS